MQTKKLSRRDFLRLSALTAAGAALGGGEGEAERSGHSGHDGVDRLHGGQGDEVGAVGEVIPQGCSYLHGQTCLAAPSRTDQRQQPAGWISQQLFQLRQFPLPAHKWDQRGGQLAGPVRAEARRPDR